MMINTLFTSTGRRVELLNAFRKAYQSLDLAGNIIAVDADPLASAFQVADRKYTIPLLRSPDCIRVLCDICRKERVDLIFPLIDPDIAFLSQNRVMLEETGARVIAVTQNAVEITSDKWLTMDFFRRLGLQVPQSWLPAAKGGMPSNFPLFVKPRAGSAGKDSFKIHNKNELDFFLGYVREPIIQEFLPGPEISSDVVAGFDGEVLGIVSRQRIDVRGGEVTKGVTVRDDRILQECIVIAKELPAIGPITVQCIVKNGIPHFTEINARFGGGAPLGFAAGMDSPQWLLAKAAGIPVNIPPVGCYKTPLYLTRCDHSYFVEGADLAKIAGNTL